MTKVKICLDAGHYGKYNRSPAVNTYYESDMNWKLHLKLKAELEKYGIEVITTRKEQTKDMDLIARGRKAKDCNLFLSIHSNAVDGKVHEDIDYPVAYVPINGSGDALGKKLSECIASVMGTKQRAEYWSKKSTNGKADWYGVIYGASLVDVPGIILEHSFHTNTRSAKWLLVDSNLDKLAKAEAEVIAEHYGLKKPVTKPEPKPVKDEYTLKGFIRDIQSACGAAVDGIAGPDTLSKTVTLSAKVNVRHPAVKAVQKRLLELGYREIGTPDGVAGPKFTSAVAHFQLDNGCTADGEITAKNKTWKKLLGMPVEGSKPEPKPEPKPVKDEYTLKEFVSDIQSACGASVDGIAGQETLSKTVTLSVKVNARHPAVKHVQKRLAELGYSEVGAIDGVAGSKFTSAVAHFQKDNGCIADGEITAKNKTWKKLLGMA